MRSFCLAALLCCALPAVARAQTGGSCGNELGRCSDRGQGASPSGDTALWRSVLWRPRLPVPGEPDARAALGGINDGFTRRPGLERSQGGFEAWPVALPEGGGRFELSLSEQFGASVRNVDEQALIDRHPNTLPEDLLGNRRHYAQLFKAWTAGPLSRDLYGFAELLDEHVRTQPLGARVAEQQWRPRYTLNLSWFPDARTAITLGGRHERIDSRRAGLSAWDLTSAARRPSLSETSAVLSLRHQPVARLELGGHYRVALVADDVRSAQGIGTPGHSNLDSLQTWGNYPWTVRDRALEHQLDAHVSGFFSGRWIGAHTVTAGLQVTRATRARDETRNGGFTFVDVLAQGASLREDLERERSSWLLFSSDRGDETHALQRQYTLAGYLEDRIDLGPVELRPGLRVERFVGGFDRAPRVYETLGIGPRLGVRIDLLGDGRSRLFAQAGRHFQRLTPDMYLRARQGAAISPLSYWDYTGDPTGALPTLEDPGWTRRRDTFPANLGSVDGDLEHPHMDRLALGLSQYVRALDLTGWVRYTYERHRALLGLYDASDVETDYRTVSRTQGQATVDYLQLRPGARADYRLGNPPGAFRRVHELSSRVQVDALDFVRLLVSFRYRLDRANLDTRSGVSLEWQQPSGRLRSEGFLPGDRYRFAAMPRWYLPGGVTLDTQYTLRVGDRYSQVVQIFPPNAPRAYVYDARARGGYVYPTRHLLDLRVTSPSWQAGPGRMRAMLRADNVLNARYVTGFREVASTFEGVSALEQPFTVYARLSYDI